MEAWKSTFVPYKMAHTVKLMLTIAWNSNPALRSCRGMVGRQPYILIVCVCVCVCVCVYVCVFGCVWLFGTTKTVAHEVPLSMGFPKQEYGVDCHFLLQGVFYCFPLITGIDGLRWNRKILFWEMNFLQPTSKKCNGKYLKQNKTKQTNKQKKPKEFLISQNSKFYLLPKRQPL